jgi:uncharacterized YccA/Bax inhibitor family protein
MSKEDFTMRQSPLFSNIQTGEAYYDEVNCASYKGITVKTFILLGITALVGAMVAFYLPEILQNNFQAFFITLAIASVVGFISVMVGRFSESKAKYASVIYSVCEGLFLGTLTCLVNAYIPGAATIAVFSTLIIFGVMLTLFATGILRVGTKFRRFCFAFTLGAIAIILFMSIASLFIDYSSYLNLLIGIELFLLIYGAITLGLNFAEAQAVVERGASKDAEWSVSLGLMVSIIYIYVEILRLIYLVYRLKDR